MSPSNKYAPETSPAPPRPGPPGMVVIMNKALRPVGVGLVLLLPVGVILVLLAALGALPSGCGRSGPGHEQAEEPEGPPWFQDVTELVGMDFVHDPGPVGDYFGPQIVGSGAALFDFDGDGRLDIYLLQNGGPDSKARNRLYRQLPDGRFQDVSAGSGLDVAGWNMGVAVADVNNDGRPDVLLTQYGGVRLFLNNGDGTFTDATRESGLDNPAWGTSAAFLDYDRDGWLDLVVVNYVDYEKAPLIFNKEGRPDFPHPNNFKGTVSRLFRNLGPKPGARPGVVHFQDVTLASGLGRRPGPALGVVCADFNGDGWPDIFVANDAKANHLWINQHDGTFTEEAEARHVAFNGFGQPQANMGIAVGDLDGKGLFSLFVTHLTDEYNTLWKQESPGRFQDKTAAAGLLGVRGTGFGTVFGDFDHDGHLDLAIVNGRVARSPAPEAAPHLDPFWRPYAERDFLLANDARGKFRNISAQNRAFCGRAHVGRGLACGSVFGDGALDLLVTTVGGRAHLFRNVAPGRGHWLLVRAIEPALGGRDAYGAVVTVEAGGRRWTGLVNPGYSYLCSNDPRAHFGLGKNARVEALHVLWPDGKRETFPGRAADRVVVLRKGEGKAAAR